MNRTRLHFGVGAAAFVSFVLLVVTGVLMRQVLPPGGGRFATLWGLNRHQWGDMHFWIALPFLLLLVIHLSLHWRWILTVMTGKTPGAPGWRWALRSDRRARFAGTDPAAVHEPHGVWDGGKGIVDRFTATRVRPREATGRAHGLPRRSA
ncbi:MAG: DUF4405 domain-containing protein [Magnetococcales bacterium]|nr:DUF4405 domain-containing protein [Magnetococcales bacterium]